LGFYAQDLGIIVKLRAVISQTQSVASLSNVFTVLQQVLIGYFLAPALAAFLAIFLWGLVQSKFLFKMGLLSFDFSRLSPRCSFAVAGLLSNLSKNVLMFFLTFACMALIWRSFGVATLEMLQARPEQAVVGFFEKIKHQLPLVVILFGFLVLALLLMEKLRFAFAHRMTRKEVQAEQQ
jgi:flagellar biosynthesis protein FlhB